MNKREEKHPKTFTVTGKFCGFTNTTSNTMFFDHTANTKNSNYEKWIPATIKVEDEELQQTLKEMKRNTLIEITIERVIEFPGLGAKLLKIDCVDLQNKANT